MARLDAAVLLLLLAVSRGRTLDLEDPFDYGDDTDDAEPPAPPPEPLDDFSAAAAPEQQESPAERAESVLGSDIWPGGSHAVSAVSKRAPVFRRTVRARAATPDELQQLFGADPARRKKSTERRASKRPRASLLRQYLRSALDHPRKRKRSAAHKRHLVRRVVKRARPPTLSDAGEDSAEAKDGGEAEDGEEEAGGEEAAAVSPAMRRLLLSNALLTRENGLLTEALNEATLAQTRGNGEETVRAEMAAIRGAEQIETLMRQLEADDRRMSAPPGPVKDKDRPDDVEETVLVTDTAVADLSKCPVVKALSTGCARVTDAFGYRMDEDAIDACDAHRICYGCSSAFSASGELCDRLFIAQSRNLCRKEADGDQCEREALGLLEAMRSVHEPDLDGAPARQRQCRSPCVRAYFRAVYRPRR